MARKPAISKKGKDKTREELAGELEKSRAEVTRLKNIIAGQRKNIEIRKTPPRRDELEVRLELAGTLKEELVENQRELEALNQDLELHVEELSIQNEELLKAQEALAESEGKFRALAEASPAIILFHQGGKYLYVNPAAEAITGYSHDELLKMDFWGFIAPEDRNTVKDRGLMRLQGENPSTHYPVKILTRQGREKWIEISAARMEYRGQPAIMVTAHDITERKRAEKALWESEGKYRALFESSFDAVIIALPDGRIESANAEACRIFGKTEEEIIRGGRDGIADTTDPRWRAFVEERERMGKSRGELNYRRKDDTIFPGEASSAFFTDSKGRTKVAVIIRDITERKMAEAALRESEEKFRALFEGAGAAIFVADVATGCIIDCNRKAVELTGRPRGEIIGLHQTQIHPANQVEAQREQFKRHAMGVVFNNDEAEVQHRDGRVIPVIVNAAPVKLNGRDMLIGFFLDITERRRAEEALGESEKKFRVVAETSPAAIFLYQGEKYVYVNPMAETLTGYSRDELMAGDTWEWIHPEFKDLVKDRARKRQKGKPIPSQYEVKYRAKDGREGWVDFSAGLIEYGGKPAGLATAFDVTERMQAEEELKSAKQQAELYLDLMAHDINNMHQVALGYLELAKDVPPGGGQTAFLDKPVEVLQRSTKLIDNVRKLQKLRDGLYQAQEVDVCRVLAAVRSEYEAVSGKNITLSMDGHRQCFVSANALLHDVFSNLVNNAVKHTGDRAEITVSLDMIEDTCPRCYRVAVEDNGPGIPDEAKERIFNRMHMGSARGMGLGLYIVRTLVNSYGGKVWAEDRVKGDHAQGARFVVMLPAVEK